MVENSVEIVLFAIRSGIKLGREMRQAYVDSTKKRELVLPMPKIFGRPDIVSASTFFAGDGKGYVKDGSRLGLLLGKYQPPDRLLSPEEEREVMTFYEEFYYLDAVKRGFRGEEADSMLTFEEFNSLLTIRQWARGEDPNATVLERLAGTFIEIGIDYFSNIPGALNKDSKEGKAVAGFLEGIRDIKFTEVRLGAIPGRLFVAAVETISENTGLLSGDAKVQELIAAATKGLSESVAARLKQLESEDLTKEEKVGEWAELVFRSLLSSSSTLVLSNPRKYLGVNEGESALIGQVGSAVLGLVLDDSGASLDRLFSREGLEKITKSALAVVGDHPEIMNLSDSKGIQKLLTGVAARLCQYDTLLTPDILPELARLILEKTGENLALLWPDLAKDPSRHLLLTAAETTLAILTRKPKEGEKWQAAFSRADVLAVAETVFREFTANPSWLLDKAGNVNENLKIALDAVIGALRSRADKRLSTGAAVDILRTVLTKVGTRKEFLDKVPAGTLEEKQALVAVALDALFRTVFDDNLDERAVWQLVRGDAMNVLVDICMTELGKTHLEQDRLDLFREFLKKEADRLAGGEPFSPQTFEAELAKAVADSRG